MTNIAIFASGSGTNAENIAIFFKNHPSIKIKVICTNNPKAGVIERANNLNIKCITFDRKDFYESDNLTNLLKEEAIDFLVLAGFLWLVPPSLIDMFPNKMVNIHPALLPNYGGKGMYGDKIHKAVVANKEKTSGITIHYVNNEYDQGEHIFQAECTVEPTDDYQSLAKKIHTLEYEHFPKVIEEILSK